ncbi:MAG: bile acid:sodium symporter family protein [Myxococcota bacterium]
MDPSQFGPFVLVVLMTVVGMDLTLADFRRVLAAPRAVVGGTLAQLLLLPLMTWGVVTSLDLAPVFGAGAVLVAVSPGAGISNIMVALAGANVALSVSLTAFASVLAVVTLPTLSALFIGVFLDDAAHLSVPVVPLVRQLALSLLLPILFGMWVRQRWPGFAMRNVGRLQRYALLGILLVVVVAVALGDEQPDVGFADARGALLGGGLWTLCALAIGMGMGTLLRLPERDRTTFAIEFAARNIAVTAIVALSGLGRLDLTLFAGAYTAVGYPMCFAFAFWRSRRHRKADG